jgi:hypothetical protein
MLCIIIIIIIIIVVIIIIVTVVTFDNSGLSNFGFLEGVGRWEGGKRRHLPYR